MSGPNPTPEVASIALDVLAALANKKQIPPFSSRPGGLSLSDAYRVTPLLRGAFEARGEKITGRKIGFTNSGMWKAYGSMHHSGATPPIAPRTTLRRLES
jgi:2-keto-4-pentenoate hydratase